MASKAMFWQFVRNFFGKTSRVDVKNLVQKAIELLSSAENKSSSLKLMLMNIIINERAQTQLVQRNLKANSPIVWYLSIHGKLFL